MRRLQAVTLSEAKKKQFFAMLQDIKNIKDDYRQIIAADALCSKALAAAGVTGSMGEQLKAIDNWYPRIDNIWRAHKLRNKLAHEPSFTLKKPQKDHAMAEFEYLLQSL
jgi:hypothetical protein